MRDLCASMSRRSFAAGSGDRVEKVAQRFGAARERDPNAAWKAQAQTWLDELPR